MEHSKKAGSNGWKLLVDKESAASCGGKKYCRIVATLTGKCPEFVTDKDGYITTQYGKYKLHQEKKLFGEAEKSCKSEGGHLLVINSKEELDLISNYYFKKLAYPFDAWIGASQGAAQGSYIDIFGKPLVPFWAKGEPNNSGVENCVALSHIGLYIDLGCTREESYLCKK